MPNYFSYLFVADYIILALALLAIFAYIYYLNLLGYLSLHENLIHKDNYIYFYANGIINEVTFNALYIIDPSSGSCTLSMRANGANYQLNNYNILGNEAAPENKTIRQFINETAPYTVCLFHS